MKINETTAISTSKALLVPYEAHHVKKYHAWMQDPDIQEATASEPMTLEEEYENQQSWRTSHDKLTFIICAPTPTASSSTAKAGQVDGDDLLRGDINFFLYPSDDDNDPAGVYTGEVDVMIASTEHRKQGLGRVAVCALLVYLRRHMKEVMAEFAPEERDAANLKGLMVKIKQGNEGSRKLFGSLGFKQQGEVNYFGEVMMVMGWDDIERGGWWTGAVEDYEEVEYCK